MGVRGFRERGARKRACQIPALSLWDQRAKEAPKQLFAPISVMSSSTFSIMSSCVPCTLGGDGPCKPHALVGEATRRGAYVLLAPLWQYNPGQSALHLPTLGATPLSSLRPTQTQILTLTRKRRRLGPPLAHPSLYTARGSVTSTLSCPLTPWPPCGSAPLSQQRRAV